MERNSVEDLEWVKIGDSQEGDGFEDDEVPLDNLSPAQLRELVLAGRKRVADLKARAAPRACSRRPKARRRPQAEHKGRGFRV